MTVRPRRASHAEAWFAQLPASAGGPGPRANATGALFVPLEHPNLGSDQGNEKRSAWSRYTPPRESGACPFVPALPPGYRTPSSTPELTFNEWDRREPAFSSDRQPPAGTLGFSTRRTDGGEQSRTFGMDAAENEGSIAIRHAIARSWSAVGFLSGKYFLLRF